MTNTALTHRLAMPADIDTLRELMDAAISELQKPFLDAARIASSRTIMGLDTQLIADGTYFVIRVDGEIAGRGGWSRRATLYSGEPWAILPRATPAVPQYYRASAYWPSASLARRAALRARPQRQQLGQAPARERPAPDTR